MANTLALLDSLGVAEDGISTAYPDTFVDDLRGAYTADADAAAARISILEADLAEAKQQILLLQAHNYELMTSAPAEPAEVEEEESPASDEPEDNDDNSGISSLFGKKDKED